MAVYFCMIAISVMFAVLAVRVKPVYSVKLQKSGTLVKVKPRNFFAALSFIPVFLVSALRYQVGIDYMSYSWIFDAVRRGEKIHAEMGFRWLNELILMFTNKNQWIFIVTSVITLALIFYGIFKHSASPAISIFLLVTMGYLFSSFNILRQYVAVAIIFASLRLIKENRFIPFVALVVIAMLFHKTAIVMLPFYFLTRLRLKQSYLIMITLISACFIPLRGVLTNLLTTVFYPQYKGTDLIKPLTPFEFAYYALVLGVLVLMCMAYKSKFFNDDYSLILFNSVFYSLILYTCFSFVPEINRIALYIELFVILLIPRVIQAERDIKVRRLYCMMIVVGMTAFFVVTVGLMGRFGVTPYQTIFSKL